MTQEDKDTGHIFCEICGDRPVNSVQGGIHPITKERGLWMCCETCKKRISDERDKERRKQC
jgi:hypothetical protein